MRSTGGGAASAHGKDRAGRGAGVPPITLPSGAIAGRGNDRVKVKPLLARVGNWRDFPPGDA